MPSEIKPLPIGIQTFEKLIKGAYLYVDKTPLLYELVKNPSGVYFLSRPRRFGKSLTISTLEAIFTNRRELFKGLWIDSSDYQWQEYPVIRIDMAELSRESSTSLKATLIDLTNKIAQTHDIKLDGLSAGTNLRDLIQSLKQKYQKQVVVLIDEYDKAILDNLNNTEVAKECRDILREFYTILKSQDRNLRFVFLTGVSKFSKVSIFSGLNNLSDISMDAKFASLCGYTQEELDYNFKNYIEANGFGANYPSTESLSKAIQDWYNGYRFSPDSEIKVYNPFSTLLLFQNKSFKNYWFASGTPKFLIDIIDENKFENFIELESYETRPQDLESFDFENFHLPSVLYQAGYLTIKKVENFAGMTSLELSYPNKEVRESFSEEILNYLTRSAPEYGANNIIKLAKALHANNLDLFFEILKSYLAGIPYDIQISQEKYFQSLIFLICRLISEKVQAEVRSNKGRIDMLVETQTHAYIFEFKLDSSAREAISQIRTKQYYEQYLNTGKEIKLIGINFSTSKHNIDEWIEEKL